MGCHFLSQGVFLCWQAVSLPLSLQRSCDFSPGTKISVDLWLSEINMHQNHLESLLKQRAGPYPQSFWFSNSGMGTEMSISNKFLDNAKWFSDSSMKGYSLNLETKPLFHSQSEYLGGAQESVYLTNSPGDSEVGNWLWNKPRCHSAFVNVSAF